MGCPHLSGVRKRLCAAVQGLVALSGDELDAYCDSGAFRECPVFQELARRGRKVPLRDYGRWLEKEGPTRLEKGVQDGNRSDQHLNRG